MDFLFLTIASVVGLLLLVVHLFNLGADSTRSATRPNEFLVHYLIAIGLTFLADSPWFWWQEGLMTLKGFNSSLTILGIDVTFVTNIPIFVALSLSVLGCLNSTGVFSISRILLMILGLIDFVVLVIATLLSPHPESSIVVFSVLVLAGVCYHFVIFKRTDQSRS